MKKIETKFVNAKEMISEAQKGKYAIAHINTNNMEWAQAILQAAQETQSPVIIGVSEGAAKYHWGFPTCVAMINALMIGGNITVPVVLHLDHGTFEGCKEALAAGFSSVMFDGSHLGFKENLNKTAEITKLAKHYGASMEAEVGTIGGEEDGVIGNGEIASPAECRELAALNIDMLAAGIGNIHGLYPDNWKGLDFDVLKIIATTTGKPIVLHGGSGIPDDQIRKAVSLGVAKLNVNTECQLVFTAATRVYFEENKDLQLMKKGFDPRKVLAPGKEAIKQECISKFKLIGSIGRAKTEA